MDKSVDAVSRYATEMRFEDLPAEVVHGAKRTLIDTLGCAVSGFDGEPSRIARAIARRCVGNPPARILGTQELSTPEHAAFANGTMVRFQDQNNGYLATSSCHPSDTVSAVLAIADATHADGRSVILATAVAYEVCCNFADVLPREQGVDNVYYCLVGSAVASGKILGLTPVQMGHAVALALVPNLTLEQTRAGELSMWKGCAGANAARNGVFAAQLAQQGMTGPEEAIEGKWGLWHAIGRRFAWAPFGGRGGPFRITQVYVKSYPAVGHAQSPITAAFELYGQVDIEAIESLAIDTYWVANRYVDRGSPLWHPATRETADHSIPYMVAAALIDGDFTVASFRQQLIDDPRLHRLMGKMSVRETAEFTAAYPVEMPCRIEITTKAGQRKVAYTRHAKGHRKNPLSDAELEARFRQLAGELLDSRQTAAILAKLWRLDEIGDVGELLQLFAVSRHPEA